MDVSNIAQCKQARSSSVAQGKVLLANHDCAKFRESRPTLGPTLQEHSRAQRR